MTSRSTPRYIGLRTNRYEPRSTNLSGGAHGAGVPRPWSANRAVVSSTSAPPQTRRTTPRMRSTSGCESASQRVSSHGTIPATIIGPPRKTKPTLPEMTRARERDVASCGP